MKQAKVLSDQEVKRVLAVIGQERHPERNRMAFMLSYLAGMRACEISGLVVGDVIDTQSPSAKFPMIFCALRFCVA